MVVLLYYSHRSHGTAIFTLLIHPFKSAIHGSVNISIAWILWDWYLYHVLSADCPWYLVWVQILQILQPLSMTKSCQKGRLRSCSCTDFLGGGFNHVLFCHYLARYLTNIFNQVETTTQVLIGAFTQVLVTAVILSFLPKPHTNPHWISLSVWESLF